MAYETRWLTIRDAADLACCEPKMLRRAVRAGRLRAARGADGELKFLESWIDEWLADQLMPHDSDVDLGIDAAGPGLRGWLGR